MNIRNNWRFDKGTNYTPDRSYTVSTLPKELSLSNNMTAFGFSPASVGTPVFSSISIRVINKPNPGEVFTLSTSTFSVTLRASLTPSGNEYWTFTGGITVPNRSRVAESIAYELGDSTFGQLYDISVVNDTITVTAKTATPNLDMTLSFTGIAFSQTALVNGVAGQLPASQIENSLFAQVITCTGQYGQPIDRLTGVQRSEHVIPYHKTTDVFINVADSIKFFLEPTKPLKRYTSAIGLQAIDANTNRHLLPYYVSFGDFKKFSSTGSKKRVLGGVSSMRWLQLGNADLIDLYDLQNYVWTPSTSFAFKALTEQPDNKEVTFDSHEYFNCIVKNDTTSGPVAGNWGVRTHVTFDDGTTQTIDQVIGLTLTVLGGNLSLDVSPFNLGLSIIEATTNKQILNYTVRIFWDTPAGLAFSQERTYRLYRQCDMKPLQIVYINRYGGYDSVEFKSYRVSTLSVESQKFSRAIPFNANSLASQAIQAPLMGEFNKEVTEEFTMSTGLIPAAQYKHLKELVTSTSVWLHDDVNRVYREVIVTETNYQDMDEGSDKMLSVTCVSTTPVNTVR